MLISSEIKKIVEEKYAEAVQLGNDEVVLSEDHLGGLKLYINKKPTTPLLTFTMEDGAEVYVGGNLSEAVS